jgi:hypothetical protein
VEPYPVDLAAQQIVRWLMNEERRPTFDLLVRTTRSFEHRDLGPDDDSRFGDVEREDLGENTEVGIMEVAPRRKPSLWTLRIRVADDIGPGLPEDAPVPSGEEEIDLPTFYEEFIKNDRGLAEVSAEVESPAAKGSLTRVLDAMREDRHRR